MRIIHIERLKSTRKIYRTQLVPEDYPIEKVRDMHRARNENAENNSTYEMIEVEGAVAEVFEHVLSSPTRTKKDLYIAIKSVMKDLEFVRDHVNELSDNIYNAKSELKNALSEIQGLEDDE